LYQHFSAWPPPPKFVFRFPMGPPLSALHPSVKLYHFAKFGPAPTPRCGIFPRGTSSNVLVAPPLHRSPKFFCFRVFAGQRFFTLSPVKSFYFVGFLHPPASEQSALERWPHTCPPVPPGSALSPPPPFFLRFTSIGGFTPWPTPLPIPTVCPEPPPVLFLI